MKMHDHVTQLSRSLNFQIRNLNRNQTVRGFQFLPQCRPFPHSVQVGLLWCPLKWHFPEGHYPSSENQNRCARLIFKKPKRTHSSPLLKELHWLPVAQRIQFRTLVHTFKSLNNLSPHYISSLLPVRKPPAYSLRSSTVTCLHVPKTRTLTGDRAFSSSAPRLWNNLPATTRGITTIASFKKSLKRHLFPN